MALSDYRLCDQCGGKAFYDARLNYEWGRFEEGERPCRIAGEDGNGYRVDYVGDWAVLCTECAKTHRTMIVPTATGERGG